MICYVVTLANLNAQLNADHQSVNGMASDFFNFFRVRMGGGGEHKSFCGVTDTFVLDFWRPLSHSLKGGIPFIVCFVACAPIDSSDSPLVRHPLKSGFIHLRNGCKIIDSESRSLAHCLSCLFGGCFW